MNQSKRAPLVCADGLIKGYARRPWILAAAQSLSLRRDFQTLNGGKVRGISHAADSDPKHIAEGRSRREWCREEPHPEEPYALIGHVRFCEERRPCAGAYSILWARRPGICLARGRSSTHTRCWFEKKIP